MSLRTSSKNSFAFSGKKLRPSKNSSCSVNKWCCTWKGVVPRVLKLVKCFWTNPEKTKFPLKFYERLQNTSPVDKTLPFPVWFSSLKSFASSERNARKFYTFIQTQFFRNFYFSAYYFSLLCLEKNIRHFESKRFIQNRPLDESQCQLAPIFNLCHKRIFEIE